MKPTVLVTAPKLAKAGADLLAEAGARVIYLANPDSAESTAEVEQLMAREPIDAVISRTVQLSARAIAACPTLKVISKHGVGVSNIDVDAATARGIPVYVTPGANAQSVAEMTLGLMLAAARRIGWMDRELHEGRWSRAQDGVELQGKTLGLVGFGQVGQRVARVGLALGMQVVAFDPAVRPALHSTTGDGVSPVAGVRLLPSVDALLPLADVLSLHVPLNRHTRQMLGAAQFAALPRGAIVVNTARGEVIDEPALVAALQSGHLYAAGLDTMADEPLPAHSPLAALPNVVLTPHVGGSTPAALAGMASGAARNVLGWLQGQPADASACVNPQVLSSHAIVHGVTA
ncbi:hydroxyacid dehydrogenase [Variovorax sp. J22G73]|uniref:hydroxyacid dehydrogenase n=1 Tax=unclassified Variovorax TaxID=663243 RepID=UPI000D5DF996|nr:MULTISPECIES: hydroxyacid dehydrogenase [unclassified Variovorax]MDM0003526.1 hydroxyacid dehydrogenase [Variovorax sp. J22R203]MDM0096808.1 hydroxyacid dehydrogenase [Variovorax sp. J22G73]